MLIYLWSNSLGDNWFSVQRAKSEQTSKKTKQGVTWVQTLKTLLLNPKRARYGLGFALSAFPISTLLARKWKGIYPAITRNCPVPRCCANAAVELDRSRQCERRASQHTLRASSLLRTFLQTWPELVTYVRTPLKGQPLSPRSCPPTLSAPFERSGYNKTVEIKYSI